MSKAYHFGVFIFIALSLQLTSASAGLYLTSFDINGGSTPETGFFTYSQAIPSGSNLQLGDIIDFQATFAHPTLAQTYLIDETELTAVQFQQTNNFSSQFNFSATDSATTLKFIPDGLLANIDEFFLNTFTFSNFSTTLILAQPTTLWLLLIGCLFRYNLSGRTTHDRCK